MQLLKGHPRPKYSGIFQGKKSRIWIANERKETNDIHQEQAKTSGAGIKTTKGKRNNQ